MPMPSKIVYLPDTDTWLKQHPATARDLILLLSEVNSYYRHLLRHLYSHSVFWLCLRVFAYVFLILALIGLFEYAFDYDLSTPVALGLLSLPLFLVSSARNKPDFLSEAALQVRHRDLLERLQTPTVVAFFDRHPTLQQNHILLLNSLIQSYTVYDSMYPTLNVNHSSFHELLLSQIRTVQPLLLFMVFGKMVKGPLLSRLLLRTSQPKFF